MPKQLTSLDTQLTVVCRDCKKDFQITVRRKDYYDWKRGVKLCQNAFPYLGVDERELLISKTCGACFDKLFG
jgi:two-component SAPR family response regulator